MKNHVLTEIYANFQDYEAVCLVNFIEPNSTFTLNKRMQHIFESRIVKKSLTLDAIIMKILNEKREQE